MTKNEIRADLCLAINLAEQLENQLHKIEDELNSGDDTIIGYWFDKICSFEPADIDEIMKDFESADCFKDNGITEDGPAVTVPELSIDDDRNVVTFYFKCHN